MAMSKEQKEQAGTWLYRLIMGAICLSIYTKVDKAVDLTIKHEERIDNLQKAHIDMSQNYRELSIKHDLLTEKYYTLRSDINSYSSMPQDKTQVR